MNDKTHDTPQKWYILRQHFCFLPLQISHFDELNNLKSYFVPAAQAQHAAQVEDRIAYMHQDGHVFVDTDRFAALSAELEESLDLDRAQQIRYVHQNRLKDLKLLSNEVANFNWSVKKPLEWLILYRAVAQAIAELAPYGMVTKILPRILLSRRDETAVYQAAAKQSQAVVELHPHGLQSTTLVKNLRLLSMRLRNLTMETDPALLRQFCQENIGHGPKAWEAPGYEDPEFIFESITNLQQYYRTEADRLAAPVPGDEAADNHGADTNKASTVWAVSSQKANGWQYELEYWERHLDTQTTLLRWAFFTAELPLLRILASQWKANAAIAERSDLLFCSRHEIYGSLPAKEQILARRLAYRQRLAKAGCAELAQVVESLLPPHKSERPFIAYSQAVAGSKPQVANVPKIKRRVFTGQSTASKGIISGPVCLILAAGDALHTFQPGAVIVARHLSPAHTPALLAAAAVVVEEGGMLQHASIVARELNIPCIVGCDCIVAAVGPGTMIEVNGRSGHVSIQSHLGQ